VIIIIIIIIIIIRILITYCGARRGFQVALLAKLGLVDPVTNKAYSAGRAGQDYTFLSEGYLRDVYDRDVARAFKIARLDWEIVEVISKNLFGEGGLRHREEL
jgi:hypothetical protein